MTESTADESVPSPPPRTLEINSAAISALMYFNQMMVGKSDCNARWDGHRFNQRLKGVERFRVLRSDDHSGRRELNDDVRTAHVDLHRRIAFVVAHRWTAADRLPWRRRPVR